MNDALFFVLELFLYLFCVMMMIGAAAFVATLTLGAIMRLLTNRN